MMVMMVLIIIMMMSNMINTIIFYRIIEMYNSRKHSLTIEHCRSCYKHPELKHSETLYVSKYQQIEREISKKSDRIILSKKQKFREGSFEIYFNRLLLYSKLNSPPPQAIKIKLQQLLVMIDCLILKSAEQFEKLKFKVLTIFATNTGPKQDQDPSTDKQPPSKRGRIDLYSYLKKQLKNNKFSLKTVNNAIVALIQPPLHLKTIPEVSRYTGQSRQITKRNRPNLKNKDLQKHKSKRQPLEQNTNMLESILISQEDQYKGFIKKSLDRNFNSSNLTHKKIKIKKNMLSYFSVDKKQHTDSSDKTSNFKGKQTSQDQESFNSKYCYLFKEVDQVPKEKQENDQYIFSMISQKKGLNFVDMSLDQINEEPSLLSLDSWEGKKSQSDSDSKNSEQMVDEIIEKQGLKMNLPIKIAITKKKSNSRSSRKYSFLLNKEIENIERQLKSQFGDTNQQITYSENLKFHKEIQEELELKPPQKLVKSVKILQDQNNSSISSDSLDLMQQQVNSKKIMRPSANCLSMRDILSNNKIEKPESEKASQNSVTSLDLKLITNEIYNGIQENIQLQIQSKFADPTGTKQSEQLLQNQYRLSEFDTNYTNRTSNKNFSIKLSNDHQSTLSQLAQTHKNFDHFASIMLQIEKLYSTQFCQIFGFVDFDQITLESYLFYLMRDKYQEGEYQLDSQINLEQFQLKVELIDTNRQFIRVQISLLILKKMRTLLECQLRNERLVKYGKIDWLCLLYIGYLVLQCWIDKIYSLDHLQIKLDNFNVSENSNKQLTFEKLLNMVIGAPTLNIPTVNLRKVKHIMINKYLAGGTAPKSSKILSLYEDELRNNGDGPPEHTQGIKIAQILQFTQNKQNILESIVKFKILVDDDPTVQHQVLECKYQYFAIKYRELFICFHSDDLFYQQLISINPCPLSTPPSHKLLFEIPTDYTTLEVKPARLIFDFSQIYSPSGQYNKKTIIAFYRVNKRMKSRKVKLNMSHMGEINRNGNFFFELDLQPGIYYAEVMRDFEENQVHCMKVISTSKIMIMKEEVTGEAQKEFILRNIGGDDEL